MLCAGWNRQGASVVYRKGARFSAQQRSRTNPPAAGLRLRLIQPTSTLGLAPAYHSGLRTTASTCYSTAAHRTGLRRMESPEATSVVYREGAKFSARQRSRANPPDRRITPSANPAYVNFRVGSCPSQLLTNDDFIRLNPQRHAGPLCVGWNRQRRFRRLPRRGQILGATAQPRQPTRPPDYAFG